MNDILFPSPAYTESEFQFSPSNDVSWSQKRRNLYWAGSNTGGYADDSSWGTYHRQRFLSLIQQIQPSEYKYLSYKHGSQFTSTFLNGRLYNTFFTRIVQCSESLCRAQKHFFRMRSWAPRDEAFKSQLVFDLDGNGISGRYYRLLASNSVPLKQTILREWHDDRLIPWAHYVPVSLGMEELPELVRYLTSTDQGQETAKAIAELGKTWSSKALREIDFTIYLYRLLLELARVQDPTRPALL